ncbi:carbohydrate ABC transporter permease [Schleiferilactobacillus perolens]|jgi:lactose/L-arabinose transport system permease protein|nr:sugar ABC transporter permease [Schleiferilactobacillus perolens]MCI1890654.1 sugar ABC transporter permease [Schleiferilactobacillus harbinensis]MCI1912582.1 sugar ABC transporter permease [Schleiferilactobacillus harbinensis]MCI2170011.1 sugar ABC transporter permease [Schleiferilactobacillus perolens]
MEKQKHGLSKYTGAAWLMILPFLLFFVVTILIPTLMSLYFSFASIGDKIDFIGLKNFIAVFKDPLFLQSYANTFIFMIGSIPITIFLSLLFAVLLNLPHVHGQGFFRTSYYLPAVTSVVAVASVFLTFYNPTGLLNNVVTHLGGQPIPWLTDPFWARISIIIISIWLNIGFYTVMFLAGLQNISSEIYESAEIDGASKMRQFFSITIPSLKPVILLGVILSTINGLGAFETPNILFKNSYGPENSAVTVGVNLYKTSFELVDYGKASAIAWTMVIVAVILSLIQFKIGGKRNDA